MAVNASDRNAILIILLSVCSVALLIASVLAIQLLSVAYGVGAGAQIQSTADRMNVTSILQNSVAGLGSIYNMILLDYVLFVAGLGMLLSAFILYRHKAGSGDLRGYAMLHIAMAAIYFFIFEINNNGLVALNPYYVVIVYAAVLIAAVIDAYMLLLPYLSPRRTAQRVQGGIALDPSMPYSNLIAIKDRIFSQLSGRVIIVDKHMSSVDIENLHRLMHESFGAVKDVEILTSGEMLDSDFSRNLKDIKSEAENRGVGFEVMIMDERDAMNQHERFVLDSSHAYKVPPFNIIHKKSEHITRINVNDARKRADELRGKAMKYENYITKENRQPG